MYSIRNRLPPRSIPVRAESLPIQAKKPWGGLGTSVAFHAGLIVLLLGLVRHKDDQAGPAFTTPIAEPVQMVYVPVRPQPAREVERPAPDAVHAATEAEARTTDPDADLPPEMTPETPKEPAPRPREADPQPVLAQRPPEPDTTETLEEQSERLFGRPLLRQTPETPNQLGIRPGLTADRDEAARTTCVPKPRDPNAPLEMATLVGRVYSANSRPLPGAFLQIIGTSYSTYSDGSGVYRLIFDASLVDECRTQYVRVVANGYRGRNLILGVGPGVNDVVLGR
jgi:hypothetical protein